MKVPVNKIIPFSSVDGPGNRTSIFLQGCNINCRYCHNPETRNLCIHCGICVPGCPVGAITLAEERVIYHPERCIQCDQCIQICPHGASPKIMMLDPMEVFLLAKKQMPFIRGITVSGGECTLYPEFLTELFGLCKEEGLTTLIDSNGTMDFSTQPELLRWTDGVMLDIKAWSEKDSIALTDTGNRIVLNNLQFLLQAGKLQEVRTVVAPELFHVEETVVNTARLLANYLRELPKVDTIDSGNQDKKILYKLIQYRQVGVRPEYRDTREPDEDYMNHLLTLVREQGYQEVIII